MIDGSMDSQKCMEILESHLYPFERNGSVEFQVSGSSTIMPRVIELDQ